MLAIILNSCDVTSSKQKNYLIKIRKNDGHSNQSQMYHSVKSCISVFDVRWQHNQSD